MKILHLFSDWKWTGPAEPALEMVKGLQAQSVEVHLAATPLPFEAVDTLKSHAQKQGISLIEKFSLRKHFHLGHNLKDIFQLAQFIKQEKFDLVHTHRQQDHFVGGIACRQLNVPLVRSSHEGVPLKNDWRHQWLLKKMTRLYLPVSQLAANQDKQTFSLPSDHVVVMPPAIDTQKFSPENNYRDMRQELGIPQDKILVGIVARMQRHRRFQELLEAWALVARQRENVHFAIIGRGTHMEEVAIEPARKLGLGQRLTFAGYHRETYIDMLWALDVKVFLVPGSDGSCRALRQALSLGLPVVGARRGMIPELIEEGQTGLVVDDSPENLAEAFIKLIDDQNFRLKLGQQARQCSLDRFSLTHQSQKLCELYQGLLSHA